MLRSLGTNNHWLDQTRQKVEIDFKNDDIPQRMSNDTSLCLFRILIHVRVPFELERRSQLASG